MRYLLNIWHICSLHRLKAPKLRQFPRRDRTSTSSSFFLLLLDSRMNSSNLALVAQASEIFIYICFGEM